MLRILVLTAVVVSASPFLIAQETLPMKKVGVREIRVGKSEFSFPWYHVKADHHQLRTNKAWSRIDPIEGTKSMHVGHYGQMEEIELSESGHSRYWVTGVSLYASDKRGLKIGPGAVYIRRWYFEEPLKEGLMRFQSTGSDYIFCLDRIAKGTFKTIDGKPGCDLRTELDHVIGVIEVEHTYDWTKLPDWKLASITKDSFVSFRTIRNSTGKPDIALIKKPDGRHEIAVSEGSSVGGDELIDRLVYALRTCQWKELKTKRKYIRWPPVTVSKLVVNDGTEHVFTINYDSGAWVMEANGKQYQTAHPMGIFDVQFMIRKIVKEDDTPRG